LQYTLLEKRKKIVGREGGGFSMLLSPFPLARNKENENMESMILIIGCVHQAL